ncbi:MAG: exopolysaccharide biosynthesis polyprenyl glycosylphosphotransferase [Alphaproteobacteria bacterium]|nr:exopolysaccharide biosynthesis polyprenyl glycosylphosphotransferase [Alphaproteobacteria bacterium]
MFTTLSLTRRAKSGRAAAADPRAAFRWRRLEGAAAPAAERAAQTALPDPQLRRIRRIPPRDAARLIAALDWALLALALGFVARWGAEVSLGAMAVADAVRLALPLLTLKLGLWSVSAYAAHASGWRAENAIGGLALGAIAALVVAAFSAPDATSAAALSLILPATACALAALHLAATFYVDRSAKAGAFAETAVIVGATEAARRFIQRARRSGRLTIAAIVDDRATRTPERIEGVPVIGGVDDLMRWKALPDIDRIVVSLGPGAEERAGALINKLRVLPNRVDLIVERDMGGVVVDRRLDQNAAVICVSGGFSRPGYAFVKRVFDIVVSAALIVALSPLLLATAVAVKFSSRGPILFRQPRHGLNNRVIQVLKFRSMRHAPQDGALRQVQKNDPRVTRLGAILRKTSLDELPQLFNVLMGDMSLVGPRPHAVTMRAADQELTRIADDYAHRHRVRPGITGWAQINGSRGPCDTADAVRRRVELDLDYIAHGSIWLDIWILICTAPVLLGDRMTHR